MISLCAIAHIFLLNLHKIYYVVSVSSVFLFGSNLEFNQRL